ncbi:MAG: hypothetical protein HYY60_01915 [Parcubacteria group bacterium]|nr:hypothetical protein [Parcubacteria group bacterium]
MATITLKIIDGPSKFDIMLSVFMRDGGRNERQTVDFKCPDFPAFQRMIGPKGYDSENPLVWCIIDGVTRPSKDSDDTDVWTFTGRCFCYGKEWLRRKKHPFTAQYSMTTRKGNLQITLLKKDAAQ